MRITRNLLIIAVAALIYSCAGETKAPQETTTAEETTESTTATYTIDTEKSKLYWTGTMMGMYSHEGTLDFIAGKFTTTDGELTSGSFEVDMQSITPTDDGYDPENGKGPDVLVNHLSSNDFFNVEEFKTSSLQIKDGALNLTVRDKTNEVELKDFNYSEQGDLYEAEGMLTFDRKKFDVAFDHPAKEMVLSDNIEVKVKITALKN